MKGRQKEAIGSGEGGQEAGRMPKGVRLFPQEAKDLGRVLDARLNVRPVVKLEFRDPAPEGGFILKRLRHA